VKVNANLPNWLAHGAPLGQHHPHPRAGVADISDNVSLSLANDDTCIMQGYEPSYIQKMLVVLQVNLDQSHLKSHNFSACIPFEPLIFDIVLLFAPKLLQM
jgi:hypothetical protein